MRAVANLLRSAWTISLVGVVLVGLLVWLAGPLISISGTAILAGIAVRLVICIALPAIWATAFVVVRWQRRKSSERLAEEMAAPKSAAAGRATQELGELTARMREALDRLKKAGGGWRGSQYLYQIPWYIIIGPPGAGKTTALKNCGLHFPLDTANAIQGVGGTRNCDWWFSEEAVFLDTAGRYTTQDSDAEADSGEWLGFLDILKKYRRRRPVNGVLVAISVADLLRFTEDERKTHALAVRKRIKELNERLGVRLPIYVLFTKLDLIAGFVEYFDDLGKEDRDQVWGMSFPYDEGKGEEAVSGFAPLFRGLVDRLGERVIDRIHVEADQLRRGMILGLPQQFGLLQQPLVEFLDAVFRGSRYENRPLLRGAYFTSGTQSGSPIDRLVGAMAATFGLRRSALPAFSGRGRSYFLSRLLLQVVFPEAGLVGADRRVERRRRLIRIGALVAAGIATLGAIGGFIVSYFGNVALVDQVAAAAIEYRDAATKLDGTRLEWADTARLLDQLRALPTGYDHAADAVPVGLTFGLYQGDKLGTQTVGAYRRALSNLLLPKLIARVEGQLRANLNQPDFLFEGLDVELMLGRRSEPKKARIGQWFALDFASQFPAPDQAALRESLERHVTALVGADFAALPIDTQLVEQVRTVLRQVPPAQRALSLIQHSAKAADLPEWTILGKAGPAAAEVFHRLSGKPLSEGVPGLYTRDGFYRVLLPQLPEVAMDVLNEASVVDKRPGGATDTVEQVRALDRQVLALYYDEYARRWEGILGDVAIVPFRNVEHASAVLNTLGGLGSPLKQLILAVVDETKLTQAPADVKAANETKNLVAADVVNRSVKDQRLAQIMRPLVTGTTEAPPGQPVEERFRRLRDLAQGNPSQVDSIVDTLAQLYRQTSKMAESGSRGAAMLAAAGGGDGNVAQTLSGEAARMPPPFNTMLGALAKNSNALTVGGARSQINGLWQANVLPFCQQALANRYPFTKGSSIDVPLEDFARLFGPNGLVIQFFNANVSRFVDSSRRPWRWQRVDNADLGLSQEALEQFERAAAIGDGFFRGAAAPQVSFELVPVGLDASATEVAVEMGDQRLTYSHGPLLPTRLQWPPAGAPAQATLSFSPSLPGKNSALIKDGPWSFFRLLEEASITPGSVPDRFTAAFSVGGRTATFELRAASVHNPFDLGDLRRFRCPSSL